MDNQQKARLGAEKLLQFLLDDSDRCSKIYSKTFWGMYFGFNNRTPQRVELVKSVLKRCGISAEVSGEKELGREDPQDWITISYQMDTRVSEKDSAAKQINPDLLKKIMEVEYESEQEVLSFFVIPLLEQLCYEMDDIYMQYPFTMAKGSTQSTYYCDCALFDGKDHTKENLLLIVESKRPGAKPDEIKPMAMDQARSYCDMLKGPGYMVTNGDRIQVYYRSGVSPDELKLDIYRKNLMTDWAVLFYTASKQAMQLHRAMLRLKGNIEN